MDLTFEGRGWGASLFAFALVFVLAAADIALDLAEGTTAVHVLTEVAVLAVALLGVLMTGRQFARLVRDARRVGAENESLRERLRSTEAEAGRWRDEARDLLSGLGVAIDRQFDRWGLSAAEKETALLLLKGLSHKEVAAVRSVSEATARQQARAVYRKAGLSGRNDLAAYFLEDLMVPADPGGPVIGAAE